MLRKLVGSGAANGYLVDSGGFVAHRRAWHRHCLLAPYHHRMRIRRPTRGLRWYFDHNDGRLIHKWLHYFPIYQQYLEPYRGKKVTMLEIGVSHGGSLQMWRHHLGRRATIVGIDLAPRVLELATPDLHIHVGDQSDPVFLGQLAARYGGFDIVLDDGSHLPEHQIASITALWPHLAVGGVYIVEDLHTNYWSNYHGGRGSADTFMAWLYERIDDMHAFHSHDDDFQVNEWTRSIGAVHVFDSVAVLTKVDRTAPVDRKTGRPSFDDVQGIELDRAVDEEHRKQIERLGRPVARIRRVCRDPRGAARRVATRFKRPH